MTISDTDLSELHFNGQSWVDDAGDEIGMGSRTSISAIDMPTNSLDSYEPVDGATLDKLGGGQIVPDPNKKLHDPVEIARLKVTIRVDAHEPVMRAWLIADFGVELAEVRKAELDSSPAVIFVELDTWVSAQMLLALVCPILGRTALRGTLPVLLISASTRLTCT